MARLGCSLAWAHGVWPCETRPGCCSISIAAGLMILRGTVPKLLAHNVLQYLSPAERSTGQNHPPSCQQLADWTQHALLTTPLLGGSRPPCLVLNASVTDVYGSSCNMKFILGVRVLKLLQGNGWVCVHVCVCVCMCVRVCGCVGVCGCVEGGGPVDSAVVCCIIPSSATPSPIRLLTDSFYFLTCSRQTEGCSSCAAHSALSGCLFPPSDHHPPLCGAQGQGPKMGGCVNTRGCHLCIRVRVCVRVCVRVW